MPIGSPTPPSVWKSRLEAALALATGTVADVPAGLAGLASLPWGADRAANNVASVRDALTYRPRNPSSLQALSRAVEPVASALDRLKHGMGDPVADRFGPGAGTAAYMVPDALASLIGVRYMPKGGPTMRQMRENLAQPRRLHPQRGIVDPSVVLGWGKKAELPDDPILAQAVAGTPGAAIGEHGLTMRLQRNQRPEQAMEPSVRGGVFYLPEGASQAKYYSTGKSGYGGQERIAGETLIQKPLLVKGATGGKAPEAAFDTINGKGAYESMRADAIAAYGRYGANEGRKVELVTQFLDKYAPELADQAYYIVQNSRQGNQLAYALQEAAVASAVRAKGYDAVLGYSRQRNAEKSPFISEVFDVRERAYPSPDGDFEVWDQ